MDGEARRGVSRVVRSGLLCLLLCLLPTVVQAATYYVATTGQDGGACSQAAPCRTINGGIARLSGGDTLIVKPGVYEEIITDEADNAYGLGTRRPPSGSSLAAMTTIRAETPHSVTLQMSNPPGSGMHFLISMGNHPGSQYIELAGFRLNAVPGRPPTLWSYGISWGIYGGGQGHSIRFRDLRIEYPQSQGFVGTMSPQMEFLNVDINDVGFDPVTGANVCAACSTEPLPEACTNNVCHGYYIFSDSPPSWVIDGGIINRVWGHGQQVYGHGGTIRNQTVCRMTGYGAVLIGRGNEIANNLYLASTGGVLAYAGVSGNTVRDNRAAASTSSDPAFWDVDGTNTFVNNHVIADPGGCPASVPPPPPPKKRPAPWNLRVIVGP